ncbi:MAG TPA: VWA domain-containing protein [Myxococcales bacterium]|nr:VWA domain-containing protein [Myxococcales bacterium]
MTSASTILAAALQTTLLGFRVRIVDPAWLWIAPLGLVAGAISASRAFRRWRRARAVVPEGRRSRVLPDAGASQGVARGGLLGFGLMLLFVAAAGPQCGERTEIVKRTGIDLVVALDASTSMLARDVKPSRLERAKMEVTALLDKVRGDRVGLVVFAGEAFVQCPLTTDYSAAKLFLRAVDPVAMPQQGTAIAGALREARRVLEGGGRGGVARAVLLITDGEDNEGEAMDAAKELGDAGIRVYAVAVGSEEGEPIPLTDAKGNVTGYKKDREGRTVLTRTDVSGLRDLTSAAGGKVLMASGADLGVAAMIGELEKLQKGELESRLAVQYDDRYPYFAWPAFALLCVAAALGEGRFRRRSAA